MRAALAGAAGQIDSDFLWYRHVNIRGCGIGARITNGKPTRALALRIYVERKASTVAPHCRIPRVIELPRIGSIPTDVVQVGTLSLQNHITRVRPAGPGLSLGTLSGAA